MRILRRRRELFTGAVLNWPRAENLVQSGVWLSGDDFARAISARLRSSPAPPVRISAARRAKPLSARLIWRSLLSHARAAISSNFSIGRLSKRTTQIKRQPLGDLSAVPRELAFRLRYGCTGPLRPSWIDLAEIRVTTTESRFAASLNRLLQQNLPIGDIDHGWRLSQRLS